MPKFVSEGWLVGTEVVGKDDVGISIPDDVCYIVNHSRLPFISYPYEWGFEALKKAALHHLDFHMVLLQNGFNLSDATAYNIQFIGAKPIFIDLLSIVPYETGAYWLAHRQFCEQFLVPLLLRSTLGVQHNAWYRGALEGISVEEFKKLLPIRSYFSLNVWIHIILQTLLQQKQVSKGVIDKEKHETKMSTEMARRPLPLNGFRQMLMGLRRWIDKLEPKDKTARSTWGDYASENTYNDEARAIKRTFVEAFVRKERPSLLWDFGCNSGDYSVLALESGAERVIGFDMDQNALDSAFLRAEIDGLAFQPVYFDAANTSPSQGWNQQERRGLKQRGKPDSILALAFIHHLAIGRNIPLPEIVDWLLGFAPAGVIEFVGKGDPTTQVLLRNRKDIFDGYTLIHFEALLSERAVIVSSVAIPNSDRTLFSYRAKEC